MMKCRCNLSDLLAAVGAMYSSPLVPSSLTFFLVWSLLALGVALQFEPVAAIAHSVHRRQWCRWWWYSYKALRAFVGQQLLPEVAAGADVCFEV